MFTPPPLPTTISSPQLVYCVDFPKFVGLHVYHFNYEPELIFILISFVLSADTTNGYLRRYRYKLGFYFSAFRIYNINFCVRVIWGGGQEGGIVLGNLENIASH
jgi:hypothetical protein